MSRVRATSWLALGLTAVMTAAAGAQRPSFEPGEELVYRVRVAPLGTVGTGTLRVGGIEDVRGRGAYALSFDLNARLGPLAATQHSLSWVDVERMVALRFHKHETRPLAADRAEAVEIFPQRGRWRAADGASGVAPTVAPLDELSILYYVRSLDLEPGQEVRLNRHFDPRRNPVVVRALGRETIDVPAGRFETLVIEMLVRDPERYPGVGRIRMNIADDARRTPVRIRTTLPDAGTITLELDVAARLTAPHRAVARP